MSMMRASGAIPIITALQMATASLATPKSVMKTLVGRVVGFLADSSGRVAVVAQPAADSAVSNRNESTRARVRRNCTASPLAKRCEVNFISGIGWAGIITHGGELATEGISGPVAAACDIGRRDRDVCRRCS